MPAIEFHPSFLEELYTRGYDEADACIRWVKMTQNGAELGQYLELAAIGCPSSSSDLLDDADVLLRLKVEQNTTYHTQYRVIYEQSASPEIGVFRRLNLNGQDSYQLEGLCDIDVGGYNADWNQYCRVQIENGTFGVPPLETFNLD